MWWIFQGPAQRRVTDLRSDSQTTGRGEDRAARSRRVDHPEVAVSGHDADPPSHLLERKPPHLVPEDAEERPGALAEGVPARDSRESGREIVVHPQRTLQEPPGMRMGARLPGIWAA
jgi:hypothetical protein